METKTLTTPSGKSFVIKTFLSAKARNAIRSVVLAGIQIDPSNFHKDEGSNSVTGIDKISGSILDKQERIVIEQLVVSYDGKTENIYERLEDGTPEDYDAVVKAVNEITRASKKDSAK